MKKSQSKTVILAIGGGAGKILSCLAERANTDYLKLVYLETARTGIGLREDHSTDETKHRYSTHSIHARSRAAEKRAAPLDPDA